MERKVALLGIDAGNRYLIEQWANEGAMPALQSLLHRGLRGNTMSLPGVFTGDLHFYQVEGDIRGRIGEIDTSVCPLYLLSGEYDYSASPRDTEAPAAKIKGAKMTVMKGLGHFPMSENPEAFLGYLRPVLEEIAAC